jgi:3-hydroxymyristoyl/3-hydroxydecanoyl-(acyl carrier protein) dehydratase
LLFRPRFPDALLILTAASAGVSGPNGRDPVAYFARMRRMFDFPGVTLLGGSGEKDAYRTRLRLEPESLFLLGHFPGHPLLPGIAHLAFAVDAARALDGPDLALLGVRGVRFRRPIVPGDEVELTVARLAEAGEMRYELRSAAGLASSGTLVVGRDAAR